MLLAVDRYNYIVNGEAMASIDMFLKEDREFRDFMRVSWELADILTNFHNP